MTAGLGAGNVTRTHDLLITNQLLYQLSYTSLSLDSLFILAQRQIKVKIFYTYFIIFIGQYQDTAQGKTRRRSVVTGGAFSCYPHVENQ